MMKKISILCFTLIVALCIVGCGKGEHDTQTLYHQESLQSIEPTIAEQDDATGFFVNFAGNYSLQHDIELTDDTPYWVITVNNEGNEDIVVEINEVVYRIPGEKAEVINTEEKWEPGIYSVSFSGSGATSQMIGNATCVLSGRP